MNEKLRTSKALEAKVKEVLDKSKEKAQQLSNEVLVIEKQNKTIETESAKVKAQNEEKRSWIESLRKRVEEEKAINQLLHEEERKKGEEINKINQEFEFFADDAERRKFKLEEKIKRLQWENDELISIVEKENAIHEISMSAECIEIDKIKESTENAKKTISKLEKELKAFEQNDKDRIKAVSYTHLTLPTSDLV
eukprot:TRINITY_DN4321_c0_g1_i5.p1 TRINITY_DN4321_c0_g1~~TRINITY_DN4321_c0_g1_i5.p1  ORF type:complete len:195 (-),score=90.67 TRINITY_DN4321_c0_g1_i5:52-636(-)